MREIEITGKKPEAGATPAEGRYRRIFSERERSGETLVALGARHGVAPGTLSWWNYELKRRDRVRASSRRVETAVLLPVRVTTPWPAPVPAPSSPAFEVALSGGRRVLRIPAGFDPAAVRALVEAVEGGPC